MKKIFVFAESLRPYMEKYLELPELLSDFDIVEYPHAGLFLRLYLNREVDTMVLEESAKKISFIPEDKVLQVTLQHLRRLGVAV